VSVHSAKGKSSSQTPFLTFKRDTKYHRVLDGPEFDVGIFEFAQECLQVV